jgi:hypothetical protein
MAGRAFQALQHKIRADALEQQTALSSIKSWQDSIKAKDASLKACISQKPVAPPRNGLPSTAASQPATPLSATKPTIGQPSVDKTAASHTYDKGYSKWESFDGVRFSAK